MGSEAENTGRGSSLIAGPSFVIYFILAVEFCERFTYYTLLGSQKSFLERAGWSNAASTSVTLSFNTLCYLCCFAGGYAADRLWGRYKVIAMFALLYIVGTFICAFAAHPSIDSGTLYLLGAMLFVAVGTGGIKPNICNFGAEQLPLAKRESFFSYFYLAINVGSVIAFGYMTTLAVAGQPPGVPLEYGFFVAYLVAALFMFVCLVLFFAGTKWYTHAPPSNVGTVGALVQSIWGSRSCWQARLSIMGWGIMPIFFILIFIQAFAQVSEVAITCLILGVFMCTFLIIAHYDNSWIVDGDFELKMEDIRGTFRPIPIILVVNLAFNFPYSMMNGPFYSESCQMDVRLSKSTQISGSFFNTGDCFAIMLLVPVFDKLILPYVPNSMKCKVIVGLLLAAAAMAIAGVLELVRQASPVIITIPPTYSNCAPPGIQMSEMSAFWMFVPYSVVGAGEILVNPLLYYFAYSSAPGSTRGMVQAMNLVAQGAIPSAFASAVSSSLPKWQPDDLNDGGLENFYWLSIIVILVMIPVFAYIAPAEKKHDDALVEGREVGGSLLVPNSLKSSFAIMGQSMGSFADNPEPLRMNDSF